jgi:predicted restriction endonuclease
MAKVYAFENKSQRCFVCGESPVDRAHIKSRGAGGCDEDWNIILLCRQCHQTQHVYGWIRFCEKYPIVGSELRRRGININYALKKIIWPTDGDIPDDVA